MNISNEIKVLFNGAWISDDISVYIKTSTRKLDNLLENDSKDTWEKMSAEALARGSQLWDSNIYRFEDVKEKDGKIVLYFSTIPFSIRLGMNKHTNSVKRLGKDYASMGLFSSCLVKTVDNHFVFIEKSNKFYTNKKYSWVGGIFSESEKVLNNGNDLLSAMKSEIKEELGLGDEYIETTTLSAGYITENWNVCLLFNAKVTVTAEQLITIFKKKNDGEAKGLVLIPSDLVPQKVQMFEEKDREKFVILGLFC